MRGSTSIDCPQHDGEEHGGQQYQGHPVGRVPCRQHGAGHEAQRGHATDPRAADQGAPFLGIDGSPQVAPQTHVHARESGPQPQGDSRPSNPATILPRVFNSDRRAGAEYAGGRGGWTGHASRRWRPAYVRMPLEGAELRAKSPKRLSMSARTDVACSRQALAHGRIAQPQQQTPPVASSVLRGNTAAGFRGFPPAATEMISVAAISSSVRGQPFAGRSAKDRWPSGWPGRRFRRSAGGCGSHADGRAPGCG